ncbi:MAG: hypothetical protein NC388_10785 [Clostridium sp.]|nr:hypothetical protein [Clostridium sp.]
MRSIFCFLICVCAMLGATAQVNLSDYTDPQSPAPLLERVNRFGKSFPQEKVFLHLDNSCYYLGDTIWFKAYVTRTDSHTPTNLSKLLYVEVMTPDGFLYQRNIVPLEQGSGKGAIVLADSLYGGFYEVRAYTRWMLNFGRTEHPHSRYSWKNFYNRTMYRQFFRDYDKLYSRIVPVYNKPAQEGDYAREMTQRPMRRYFKAKKRKEKPDIRFYPEGGNLVAGTACRVAFEANDEEGRHMDVKMNITDSKGTVVAQTASSHRGRNTFDLPCAADGKEKYRAQLTYKDESYTFDLPDVQADGCALQAEQQDGRLTLHLTPHAVSAPLLGVSVISSGLVVAYQEFAPQEGTVQDVTFDLAQLPTGVNQLTVFDRNGRIYADRLCFVNNHDYDACKLSVGGADQEFTAFSPIEIELNLPKGINRADLSLTVRDAATDDRLYDNSTLLTEMLLGSELKGFVEDPQYYFEADDETHRRHLDLLMMVQGWRRYVWKDMAGLGDFQLSFMPEKQQTLAGSVHKTISYDDTPDIISGGADVNDRQSNDDNEQNDTDSPNRGENTENRTHVTAPDNTLQDQHSNQISQLKKEVRVKAEYVDGTNIVESDQVTRKGQFYMPMPTFYEYCTLFLYATDTDPMPEKEEKEWKKYLKDETKYPAYYVKQDLFYPQFTRPYSFYEETLPDDPFNRIETNNAGLTDRELPTVTIRTKRGGLRKLDKTKPALVIDAMEAYNHLCDWGLMTGKFDHGTFVRGIAMAYIGDMGMDRQPNFNVRHDGRSITTQNKTREVTTTKFSSNLIVNVPQPVSNPGGFQRQMKYYRLMNLDKVYIYTDYCPRDQGSEKYDQSNQPDITVDLHLIPLDGLRNTYRDRYYFPLPGLSTCEDFYSPDYSTLPPPEQKDYRRTLLWMPDVEIGEDGKARVKLFNNGKNGLIRVTVEGITPDGKPLSGGYDPDK